MLSDIKAPGFSNAANAAAVNASFADTPVGLIGFLLSGGFLASVKRKSKTLPKASKLSDLGFLAIYKYLIYYLKNPPTKGILDRLACADARPSPTAFGEFGGNQASRNLGA